MMKFSGILALAALSVNEASAGFLNHRHFHMRRAAHSSRAEVSEKHDALSANGRRMLLSIGMKHTGINSDKENGQFWFDNHGPYVVDFVNFSKEEIVLIVWGKDASWILATQPYVTASILPGNNITLSVAEGVSGGWGAVYPDTKISEYGQLYQTIGEITTNPPFTTYDVSREINMNGNVMSIATSECMSNMTTCAFLCTGGASTCMMDYELVNCTPGSQIGAQKGTYFGAASGGCSIKNSTARITTTFY